MISVLRFLTYICAAVLLIFAETDAVADTRAENAFYFAEKNLWNEALLHAEQSREPGLKALMMWQAILDIGYEVPAGDIRSFLETHADWPEMERVKLRYERALLKEKSANTNDLLAWFMRHPPVSGAGKIVHAGAFIAGGGDGITAKQLVQKAWVDGDFDADTERDIRQKYGDWLDDALHKARADRLVWEHQYAAAERMFPLLEDSYVALLKARIALEKGEKNAPALFAKVPKSLHSNAGLIFSRLVWRARKEDTHGVSEMLLASPKQPPYPEKWWRYRERFIREAVDNKHYVLAATILSNHGLEQGESFAEATWLYGWLLLEFRHDAKKAYQQFDTLYRGVNFAVSKARAAYWAGRAAEKMKQPELAQQWYVTGAAFPTTFYGQMSFLKAYPNQPFSLQPSPRIQQAAYTKFKERPMSKMIVLCLKYRQDQLAEKFIRHVMDTATTQQDMLYLAMLAREYHGEYLGVKAAKRALQYNVLLTEAAYPKLGLAGDIIESSLAHGIIRQESEFDPKAKSPANALGLMQLLPSTAREVARKNAIAYSEAALTGNPKLNTTLGSLYLSKLVQGFDGSYVLAIASYNAGPGRVRQWTQKFGTPRGSPEQVVNWIEKIPYSETRNYVQRVLENVQVYRALFASPDVSLLRLEQDLR